MAEHIAVVCVGPDLRTVTVRCAECACEASVDMPHAGILQAIEEHRPDVVGISATMLFSLPKVIRLVGDIRERFASSPPRIIVGGRAFLATPALCQELGTNEPVTDLRGALRLM